MVSYLGYSCEVPRARSILPWVHCSRRSKQNGIFPDLRSHFHICSNSNYCFLLFKSLLRDDNILQVCFFFLQKTFSKAFYILSYSHNMLWPANPRRSLLYDSAKCVAILGHIYSDNPPKMLGLFKSFGLLVFKS